MLLKGRHDLMINLLKYVSCCCCSCFFDAINVKKDLILFLGYRLTAKTASKLYLYIDLQIFSKHTII